MASSHFSRLLRFAAIPARFFHIATGSDNPCLTENPYTQGMQNERILDLRSRASSEFYQRKTRRIWNINMNRAVKTLLVCASLYAGFAANAPQCSAAEPASLSQYGLAGLAPMSNAEGAKIRGTGGSAATTGSSFISGMLLDGSTKSYIFGVDTNRGMATLQQAGIVGPIDPFHVQSSNLGLALEIENLFRGTLIGGAGGTATSFFR